MDIDEIRKRFEKETYTILFDKSDYSKYYNWLESGYINQQKQIEELKAENEGLREKKDHTKIFSELYKLRGINTKLKEGIQNILDRPDVSYCFNTEADLKALLKD